MRKTIQDHDLLPLKKEITKLNAVKMSQLTFDYIDFLEKQNISFSFKQQAFNQPFFFQKNKKSEFIQHIKNKQWGFLDFNDSADKELAPECFLETFIGKDFYELEKILHHIELSDTLCEFYRSLGLIALTRADKNFFNELTQPFNPKEKYDFSIIIQRSNIPYLMQNHKELFGDYDLKELWTHWNQKVDKFENYTPSYTNKNVTVGNQLHRKAKGFVLRLSASILLKQSKEEITDLFKKYEDILSQKAVFDFFKDNKCQETGFAFHIYRTYIENYKSSEISLEEMDLLQKNLTVDISSIMQKHLLNYDRTSQLLKAIGAFFQSEEDFQHTLITFNDIDKKCTFSLTSSKENYLKNGKEFLNKVFNDKDIFMNPEKYKATFYYIHFDNKFEVKNIKSVKNKI